MSFRFVAQGLALKLNSDYLENHQPLPENYLAPMVNLPIVGNLPIGSKGFPIAAKGIPGRGCWISRYVVVFHRYLH